MSRAVAHSRTKMAMLITRPTIGSANGKPSHMPITPSTTANEVKPSVRAWTPSATKDADLIRRPTRIRYSATSSLPANPVTPAISTQGRFVTGCGSKNRRIDS